MFLFLQHLWDCPPLALSPIMKISWRNTNVIRVGFFAWYQVHCPWRKIVKIKNVQPGTVTNIQSFCKKIVLLHKNGSPEVAKRYMENC